MENDCGISKAARYDTKTQRSGRPKVREPESLEAYGAETRKCGTLNVQTPRRCGRPKVPEPK